MQGDEKASIPVLNLECVVHGSGILDSSGIHQPLNSPPNCWTPTSLRCRNPLVAKTPQDQHSPYTRQPHQQWDVKSHTWSRPPTLHTRRVHHQNLDSRQKKAPHRWLLGERLCNKEQAHAHTHTHTTAKHHDKGIFSLHAHMYACKSTELQTYGFFYEDTLTKTNMHKINTHTHTHEFT